MATRKATAKKTAPKKKAPAAPKKAPAKKAPAKKAPAKKSTAAAKAPAKAPQKKRDDLGAPADAFFERHPSPIRENLEALRALVKRAAPAARESIKWGMPYYEMKKGFCALYASPTYAAIQIMVPPEKLEDPKGLLEGKGATMRHLKVRTAADLHEADILRWVKAAAALHS